MTLLTRKCCRCGNEYKNEYEPVILPLSCELCMYEFSRKGSSLGFCQNCFHGFHKLSDKIFEDFANNNISPILYEILLKKHNKEEESKKIERKCNLSIEDRHSCAWEDSCNDNHQCKRIKHVCEFI